MAIVGFALLHCQNNMDATSTGDSAPNPNTHSTSPGPIDFSIDDLLKRVEEFQRRQQLETLERITTENSWLEYHIARYRQNSTRTMNLLQEIYNAVTLMQKALQQCRLEEIKANRSWLAFWGIREHPDATSEAPPAGWI
jgi:predicted ATP-dependent endonuclease of OLD family